jgi:hypothetical protein
VTQITISPPIETENLSIDVGRSNPTLSLHEQRKDTRRGKAKPFVPACRWHLTYYTENGIEHHFPIATWPEDAILAVGRGIPLKAEFDDFGCDRWTPISRHLYAEFACYPQLREQQAAIDLLKAQRGCGHA